MLICILCFRSIPCVTTDQKVLDPQKPNTRGPMLKPLGGSKVDSAFHPSEVGKMRTRNTWELSGKK